MKLLAQFPFCFIADVGYPKRDRDYHRDIKNGDQQKRVAPAKFLTQPGANGNANQISNGHSRNHARDGGGDFSRTSQLRQDNSANAKKCAMWEAGNQPAHRQHKIRGREGEDGVANYAQCDQKKQNMLERKAIGKERNNGRAQHHAKGVKRNHMASGRNGNSHVPRQLSEDTHDTKLGHAQPKCSQR